MAKGKSTLIMERYWAVIISTTRPNSASLTQDDDRTEVPPDETQHKVYRSLRKYAGQYDLA